SILSRPRHVHAVAIAFERYCQEPLDLRFVVDDQRGHGRAVYSEIHIFFSERLGCSVAGRKIVKIAPPCIRLAACTRPLCASTNPFTMVKSRPVLSGFAFGARWNKSKTFSTCSTGKPGPRSAT